MSVGWNTGSGPCQRTSRSSQRIVLIANLWKRCCLAVAVMLAGTALIPAQACAQECVISTKVSQDAGQTGKPRVVSQSLSIFHAGNAYDYIIDAVGQVTIFEPAARRFVILNSSKMLTTELPFVQLDELLVEAKLHSEQYLATLVGEEDPKAPKRIALMQFQLQPEFQETFDSQKQRLTLSSPLFTYEVGGTAIKPPELVNTYLRYADRMAQLNYLLHPHALLPGPRLALNANLRQKQLMPVVVMLKADVGQGIQLKAEHRINAQLEPRHRDMIHQWETLLENPEMKRVGFAEFRKALNDEAPKKRQETARK